MGESLVTAEEARQIAAETRRMVQEAAQEVEVRTGMSLAEFAELNFTDMNGNSITVSSPKHFHW